MGKTKGRSLRLRNSKKRSIKKSKKNSKKYRGRSRKTKRPLRGVKRSMRMKGGTRRLEEQGIYAQDTSKAGDLAELRKKWIKEGLGKAPVVSYTELKRIYDEKMKEKHKKNPVDEGGRMDEEVVQVSNPEDVLRDCNIPEIYWVKIMDLFNNIGPGGMDKRSWAIVLKHLDGEAGGGILESVELRVGQEVKVWSITAGGWVDGRVEEVNDTEGVATVKYNVTKDGGGGYRRQVISIASPKLQWKFRGELGELQ